MESSTFNKTTIFNLSKKQLRRLLQLLCFGFIFLTIIVVSILLVLSHANKPIVNSGFELPCGPEHEFFAVNISDAQEELGNYKTLDGIVYTPGTYWRADGFVFGCPCLLKPCIRKCCPMNYEIDEETFKCVKTNNNLFRPLQRDVYLKLNETTIKDIKEKKIISDNYFYILFGEVCRNQEYYLLEENDEAEKNRLMEDGSVAIAGATHRYLDQSQYCLESFVGSKEILIEICFENDLNTDTVTDHSYQSLNSQSNWVFYILDCGMLLSEIFLLCTFLVYALFPKLQNLSGKCRMSYIASLIVAYGLFSSIRVSTLNGVIIPSSICVPFAFVIQFTFLGAFFWLNVMSFNTWWVFSGRLSFGTVDKQAERKKFLWFSLYAWGCPLLITAVTAVVEFVPWISDIKPQFGVSNCWFKEQNAQYLFFYLVIGALLCLNFVMFGTTLYHIKRFTQWGDVLRLENSKRHYQRERQRFHHSVNLGLVMGLNWVMELVSLAVGGPAVVWLITDFGNILQGLIIFYRFFLCDQSVMKFVKERFGQHSEIVSRSSTRSFLTSFKNRQNEDLQLTSCAKTRVKVVEKETGEIV